MRTAQRLAVGALVATVLLHAGRAWAPFHVVNIDQVFFGGPDCPNAQYVSMRMLAAGMKFVNGQMVTTQNADGSTAPEFGAFTANVTNGNLGDHFIMGTAEAAGLFGIAMDATASGHLVVENGRVCFGNFGGNPVDCVAYGDYTGDNGTGGSPATAPVPGMALVRQMNTNDDQADFALAAPAPVNNAGDAGTLGQCPGGADTPTVGAETQTPTPTPTGMPTGSTGACVGDCGGEGMVSISDLITGVNIALDSLPVSSCEAFDCDHNGTVGINCLIQGVNNALAGCPATPVPTAPGGALGVRRFSLDPSKSQFIAVLGNGAAFPTSGFEGFIELTAGVPNGGLAFVDVTDASDYLSINVPAGGTAVCLKVLRDQLPIHNAGILSCNGGVPLGIQVTQDHNIGVVGACSGGDNAGQSCSGETDCPGGACFTADDCAAAHGTVEGPSRPHPGVCNGPLVGTQDTATSPPGTLVIAPDPNGIIKGLPVELIQESSTPCGDENATGMSLAIGFTTGHSVSQILNLNNVPDMTLSGELTGEPFDCNAWTHENGPGTLVLSATNLDTQIAPGTPADIVAQFVLVD